METTDDFSTADTTDTDERDGCDPFAGYRETGDPRKWQQDTVDEVSEVNEEARA